MPTKRETEKCRIVIDKGALEIDFILPDDITAQCAKFEYFASWADKNNTMLVLNRERLGRYLHEYISKMEDDGEAILEYALKTEAIHKDMADQNPSLTPYLAQHEDDEETGLSIARQSKLDEIIGILKKGDWKKPATAENIELLLNVVFGKDTSLLDEGDVDKCEKIWALVEGGGGNRMVIIPAILAGFLNDENLLTGSPKEILAELFGKNNKQSNNFNTGKRRGRNQAFDEVIPFLKKYIDKIIRQG